MSPSAAFNIITGETGAGKSIMLGALGLLMGNRADTKVLFDEEQKCLVEGTFDISAYNLKELFEENEIDFDKECIIRREIAASGKSRAFINDTPVTLETLKIISPYLLDIHSQHDTMLLSSNEYQLSILDNFASAHKELENYQLAFRQFKKADKQYKELVDSADKIRKEAEYDRFLYEEIEKANFNDANEQTSLEEELTILENSEEIGIKLSQSTEILSANEMSVLPMLQTVVSHIDKLASYGHHFHALKERMHSVQIELKDIASEIEDEVEKIELDPVRLDWLKERLDVMYSLAKKNRVDDLQALIALREALAVKLKKVMNLDEEIERSSKDLIASKVLLEETGSGLTKKRSDVISTIETQMKELLAFVSMPEAQLKVKFDISQPSNTGLDKVTFLFTANKGVAPQELKNAASGGEFSRLMLCVKYMLADKMSLPTIIFDEIDTGISGEVAIKVSRMMQKMSQKHQVIVITHMPQIAAKGDTHFFVYKDHGSDRTVSSVKNLTENERLAEIAQMISGDAGSATALQHARELMGL